MVRFTYRKLVSWTLLAFTLLFLISGFGITKPWLVRFLTFGLLDRHSPSRSIFFSGARS